MNPYPTLFDVLVIGAGHAGCEAAFAAARLGCRTLLITAERDTLGLMPCNPAIGGLAKSHLVVELDALGGEMGLNADLTGLQYRTLNASRGPAVQATRIQCDKAAYSRRLARVAASLPTLTLLEGKVVDLLFTPPPAEPSTQALASPLLGPAQSSPRPYSPASQALPHSDPLPPPTGVRLEDGQNLYAKTIIFTSGTTLGGRIWIGHQGRDGGGDGRPAIPLPTTLRTHFPELTWRRLKTGTPPRLWNSSIQWQKLHPQAGETSPIPCFSRRFKRAQLILAERLKDNLSAYVPCGTALDSSVPCGTFRSFGAESFPVGNPIWQQRGGYATYRALSSNSSSLSTSSSPTQDEELAEAVFRASISQLPCYATHTTLEAHQIIRDHLSESALYGGEITGEGVRYCPSIEDKIVKFGDRGGHHVILEPEGVDCPWCYPNGLSNSLPFEVQEKLVHAIPGLEQASFAAPAYAIEYDCIDPRALDARLALKSSPTLFFAGQINGTTGYEEAAAQGFYAGVNAAFAVLGRAPFILSRDEAYIGVMVDDLITKGADEPYRMFTSRAERRLLLRPGNAHLRLLSHARRIGILPEALLAEAEAEQQWLSETEAAWRKVFLDGNGLSRWKFFAREGVSFAEAAAATKPGLPPEAIPDVPPDWQEELSLRAKYEGYIAHEEALAERMKREEAKKLPPDFDYDAVRGLRFEAREKLKRFRPDSLRRAASIPGVNPADVALLSIALKKRS